MSATSLAHPAPDPSPQEERLRAIRERGTRGLLLYNSGSDFAHLEGSEWAVRASEGGYWRVDLAAETCNCPDFEYRAEPMDVNCKHIYALAIAHATRRQRAEDRPCACVGGWVYLGVEEDGQERVEAVPCRRCRG